MAVKAGAKPRLAVVLFNLGGPDSLKAVRPFLFNLFMDRAIIDLPAPIRWGLAALISVTRSREAGLNYAHMGGSSPLLRETEAQAAALNAELGRRLSGFEAKVVVAMRYWRPLTREAARAVSDFRPDEVVLLPLYPQFSTTTTGSSMAEWRRRYRGTGRVHSVCCYFDSAGFVAAHARTIRSVHAAAGRPSNLRLLFSAHGLPQRLVDGGDPYQWQIEQTCEAIMAELGSGWDWRVCYQSRVGPLQWLGPSTPEALTEAGDEGVGVLVVPIAFVSEHVETLVELDRDYAQLAETAGCPVYLRVPTLGVDAAFIASLAASVEAALARDGLAPGASACNPAWAKCPYRQTPSGSLRVATI